MFLLWLSATPLWQCCWRKLQTCTQPGYGQLQLTLMQGSYCAQKQSVAAMMAYLFAQLESVTPCYPGPEAHAGLPPQ